MVGEVHRIIEWPSMSNIESMARMNTFPGAFGAVDGSHIAIKTPLSDADSYINRKSYASVVLQAVCSSNLQFIDINTGYPGSMHDARIYMKSASTSMTLLLCQQWLLQHVFSTISFGRMRRQLVIYRRGALVFAAPVAQLFNQSMVEGAVPSQWRTAVTTPIPKVPKPTQAAEYRPISITSVLSRSRENYIV